MEFGAIFILLIVLIVVGVLGGGLYLLVMYLSGKRLDPEEDKLEQGQDASHRRPEHVEVESGQGSRFVGSR